jgi:hypothetical protein
VTGDIIHCRLHISVDVTDIDSAIRTSGARGSVGVKALRYKPEGSGFETRFGELFNLPNPSGRTRTWGLLNL